MSQHLSHALCGDTASFRDSHEAEVVGGAWAYGATEAHVLFTFGVDQLPLRRTAVIQKDLYRCHMCRPPVRIGNTTAHKCSRAAQLTTCGIVAFSTRTIICSIFSAATSADSYAHTRATQPNYREGQMTAMWGVTQCRAIATAVLLCPFRRVKFTRGENEGCGGIQKRAKKKKMQTK